MSRKRGSNRRRLSIESLEDRTLLSAISFSASRQLQWWNEAQLRCGGRLQRRWSARPGRGRLRQQRQRAAGQRRRHFPAAHNFAAGAFPNSVAVGDFNGDGKPDLALTNPSSGTVQRAAGQRRRQLPGCDRTSPRTGNTLPPWRWRTSMATASSTWPWRTTPAARQRALGQRRRHLSDAQDFAVGGDPDSVAVADFNGDGKPTCVATIDGNNVSVLLGNGDGTFQTAQDFTVGGGPDRGGRGGLQRRRQARPGRDELSCQATT